MNKEIICINSHPTIESHVNATVKTFKEAEKLDVDTMYVSHHHEIPEYINKNADHIYVDKRNEISSYYLSQSLATNEDNGVPSIFNDLVYKKGEGVPADLVGTPINWEEEREKIRAELVNLNTDEEQG